ncbi:D-alanyl-D-alanine carboxypeptidase family protein [Paenibacillus sp. XY044]|uniref:M15 family metallopeptidase n=1 Tax=Paenibacillus sp. XY044 TaxID=2026089 RepID=UPI00211B5C3F|nr:M15 family metallopeptidase [Paenibacillus sp. XY044]
MSRTGSLGACLLAALVISASAVLGGCEWSEGAGQESGQALRSPGGPDAGGQAVRERVADPVLAKRSESSLQATARSVNGKQVVTNPDAVTVVVNKQRSLPEGYAPGDLVEPDVPFTFDGPHEKRHMRKEAAAALETLFAGAAQAGMELRAVSGYRSYQRQEAVYEHHVRTKGAGEAARVSAVPGTSEHQTGLTMDVSSPSVGNVLGSVFGSSQEGRWLAAHAAEYGFIVRYPEGLESITGYVYEPWHIRYIGTVLAPDIARSGLALEDYFDEANMKL